MIKASTVSWCQNTLTWAFFFFPEPSLPRFFSRRNSFRACCQRVHFECHIPASYHSNGGPEEAETERMTEGVLGRGGTTSRASAAPNHPPTRLTLPRCRPRVRPRHQDTKLTLMTHDGSSSTRAAAPFNSLWLASIFGALSGVFFVLFFLAY